jgi:DNA mismatch endonuclease (patch repair protein)
MGHIDRSKIKVPRFTKGEGFETTPQVSAVMKQIKAENTKPEATFRKALWHSGIRYRKNNKYLPGKPDVVLGKYRIAIFIDGDFWHGYNWHEKREKLKANKDYWIPKIERNIQRDLEVNRKLKDMGWFVLRFWEHEVIKELTNCIEKVFDLLIRVQ